MLTSRRSSRPPATPGLTAVPQTTSATSTRSPGAEKIEGLFTLYKTGDHLYAEIRPDQFNQPLLVPVTIARGMAQAGSPVGDDEMVLIFKRVGDRIQLVRRNIHYKAPAGLAARQGGQAELHRLGLDGAADHRDQSDARQARP